MIAVLFTLKHNAMQETPSKSSAHGRCVSVNVVNVNINVNVNVNVNVKVLVLLYAHTTRYSLSPVCGIFYALKEFIGSFEKFKFFMDTQDQCGTNIHFLDE